MALNVFINLTGEFLIRGALNVIIKQPMQHLKIYQCLLVHNLKRGLHPSTLNRRLAAIKFAYKCLNKPSPTDDMLVKATLKGIRRDEKAPPIRAKKAAVANILKEM